MKRIWKFGFEGLESERNRRKSRIFSRLFRLEVIDVKSIQQNKSTQFKYWSLSSVGRALV